MQYFIDDTNSIGQYTGNIVKPRYFCYTEYYLEIP